MRSAGRRLSFFLYAIGGLLLVGSFYLTLNVLDYYGTLHVTGDEIAILATGANQEDVGWPGGCTMRDIFPSSFVTATGRGIAVKFGAGKVRGLHIAQAFIGNSSSVVPLNYEDYPIALKFNGSAGINIAIGSSATSDILKDFVVQQGTGLIVSFFINDDNKTSDGPIAKPATPGWRSFYKCGGTPDPDTLMTAGFEDRSSKFVSHGVLELRIGGGS
ncbi:MAG TPA: hypothetical protein VN920_03095 [Pyrinomonadaceae bacterium]|nr:hypothetical protein [Pyrinomonadaceae bacterium]